MTLAADLSPLISELGTRICHVEFLILNLTWEKFYSEYFFLFCSVMLSMHHTSFVYYWRQLTLTWHRWEHEHSLYTECKWKASQIFRYLRGQLFQRGDVRQGTCGGRNMQLVPSGIRAWNSSGELTEITLLKCLYKFLHSVRNQNPRASWFHLTLHAALTLISTSRRCFWPRVSGPKFHSLPHIVH